MKSGRTEGKRRVQNKALPEIAVKTSRRDSAL
jgi:hypothetical protein